jgi:hypothetical protein
MSSAVTAATRVNAVQHYQLTEEKTRAMQNAQTATSTPHSSDKRTFYKLTIMPHFVTSIRNIVVSIMSLAYVPHHLGGTGILLVFLVNNS